MKIVNNKWWQFALPLLFTIHCSCVPAVASEQSSSALFTASAQTSDSLIVHQMEAEGVRFTQGNQVKLLMSGKDKFADMFEAIRQAKSSVHLEYFNFRNDSIASLLFDILREKRKEGVEIRAMFDGFGNDSNTFVSHGSTISGRATIVRLWSSTVRLPIPVV